MKPLMHEFLVGSLHTLGVFFIYGVVFGLVSLVLHYLSKRKTDVEFTIRVLNMLKKTLSARLGPKSEIIFDALLHALDEVQQGTLTNEQMTEQFLIIVQKDIAGRVILSESDLAVIREIAEAIFDTIDVKKKSTTMAVKAMMVH